MSSGTGTTGGAHDAQSEEAKRRAEETRQKAASEAREGGKVIAEEAKAVGQKAGELGREHADRRFEQGKERVESQVDAVGDALGDAAERLRAENSPLASYAEELSGQLSELSRGIENSTLDDIAVKTRRIARDNPGLFVLGSVVAGLAAARFFKASAEREHRERYGADRGRYYGDEDTYGYGDDFADYERTAYRGGRGAYRDDFPRDDYRDRGYGAAAGRSEAEYRSPIAGTSEPTYGAVGTSGAAGADTVTAEPSVSRVPMDSGVASDDTPKTKTGA